MSQKMMLIRACYASLEAKQAIIEELADKIPDCSKKAIERMFKEYIVKEKREGDLRPVWYATTECLASLNNDNNPLSAAAEGRQGISIENPEAFAEELDELAKARMRPLILEAEQQEAARSEELKIKEELKLL